jgi:hypothetical protein
MKNELKIFGFPVISLMMAVFMTGCYTQIGSVRDGYSSYNEYPDSDTTVASPSSQDRYYGYDDNFYGTNSFSRYRYFSYYYPTYYWNWSYDPWNDYGWYNPWYGTSFNPWYNSWYSPYNGGWGGYYSYNDPWHWSGGHGTYYNSPNSTTGRRPFGQGRGRADDTRPFDNGRNTVRSGSLPTVDLPPAAGSDRSGTTGTSLRKPPANQPSSVQPPRDTSVRKPPSSSGQGSSGSTTGRTESGRGRTETRQSTPPPAPPSQGSGTRSSGGSSGGDRGGSSGRSGGGDRGGSGRGR